MSANRRLHLEKIFDYHDKGKISDEALAQTFQRLPILEKAIHEVEGASKLDYPPIFLDPTLNIIRYPAATFSSTVIYAATKIMMLEGTYRICVVISIPFLLYASEDILRACAAHEFLHYIYTTVTLAKKSYMNLLSQRLDSPEVLIAYDETHAVEPERWLSGELVALIKNVFRPVIEDKGLETAIREQWLEKGCPTRYATAEEGKTSIPVLEVAKIPLDLSILKRVQ